MRRALKRTRKFLETTPSLADFTIRRYGTQVPYGNTDAGTDGFIRDFTLVTPNCILFQEPQVKPHSCYIVVHCGTLVQRVPWPKQALGMA